MGRGLNRSSGGEKEWDPEEILTKLGCLPLKETNLYSDLIKVFKIQFGQLASQAPFQEESGVSAMTQVFLGCLPSPITGVGLSASFSDLHCPGTGLRKEGCPVGSHSRVADMTRGHVFGDGRSRSMVLTKKKRISPSTVAMKVYRV